MAITMYQSDRNVVSPTNDASLYSGLVSDTNGTLRRGSQFSISVNGLTVTVGTGQAVIQGRLVEIIQSETLTLPANSSGTIAIAVDLTKENDVSGTAGTPTYQVEVNQAYLVAVTGKLTQDDLNNGGFLYELPIASFTSTTTSATTAVIKSVFNDTGWKDMPLADGAVFNQKSNKYARYRVLNGMCTIVFDGIDLTRSTGQSDLFKLPKEIIPNITDFQAMLFQINNFDDNNTNVYPATAVLDTKHIYTRWNSNVFGKGSFTHASGTIIYPVG
ncbi:hypothetical protein RQW99_08290 [Leuconostoc falkenbergense]|uniref:hypothetical protein n=1 Tax=Leuconostoc falkenbergense TaxID=2766470 RepID=UPI002A82B141|nr:hypothetical protein [Leuconostoc falkenbergense]MDY5164532.1 hypothetical protein [Leuconostoc falkenbergense]